MKRALASASVFAAVLAAATGMAAADAGPAPHTEQAQVGLLAEPSAGSSEILDGILLDIAQIAAGSSAKCDGLPPGHCTPYPTAQVRPIADPFSGSSEAVLAIRTLFYYLTGVGSSEPCTGNCLPNP